MYVGKGLFLRSRDSVVLLYVIDAEKKIWSQAVLLI